MKKIKITKEQAMMLEGLSSKKKVMKITEDQFDRIKGLVDLNNEAVSPMTKQFTRALPDNESRNNFIKNVKGETKIKGIMESNEELWSEFVNELYGLTESGSNQYEKLIGLMELNGYLENRKIKKSKFNDDKDLAKDVILSGVYRLKETGSPYQAIEEMEKSYEDIVKSFRDQLSQKSSKEFSQDDINTKLSDIRQKELERRKKESGEISEDVDNSGTIVGLDILNHFPFNQLPDTRKDADWVKGVAGWGKVYLPSIDSNGLTQIVAKEDFTYREVKGPKMVHKFSGYIEEFKDRFGEEPVFKINPEGSWYDKVVVINPKYLESKEIYDKGMQEWIDMDKSAGRSGGLDEITGADSSGAFVGKINQKPEFESNVPEEINGLTNLKKKDLEEVTTTISTGNSQYATPGFASSEFFGNKGKSGKAPVNKGITHKKTMLPGGKFVSENELAYPDGSFIEFDDCTKLNNNKEAQSGGCSVGAVDNVVKLKKKITESSKKTICNISTSSDVTEIAKLLDEVEIPNEYSDEISNLIKDAMYSQTKLGSDLDIINTTLRKIQNILCIPK